MESHIRHLRQNAIRAFSAVELRLMAEEKEEMQKGIPNQVSPRQLDDRALRTLLDKHLKDIAYGESDTCDDKQYIYEAVMEAYYGEKIWEFVNDRLE